jgi:phosphoribosylaminoimidazole-succinocarboxamide synthase
VAASVVVELGSTVDATVGATVAVSPASPPEQPAATSSVASITRVLMRTAPYAPGSPGGASPASGPARHPATIAVVPALKHLGSGKVREIYEVDEERLLIVASDRISAFDVVMAEPIPDKGRVLTGVSLHWFELLDTPHHLLSADPADVPGLHEGDAAELRGRMMLVHRAEVIPMECVVRGYLYGSSWKEYAAGGGPTTEHLPAGLEMAAALDEPIFTPATKAESGHDENLTEAEARALVGDELYEELRRRSLEIYGRGAAYAADRGIILADTKFEFGFVDGEITLIDEVLTPDSSRYWPADAWRPGAVMPSFDKQPVRDWLEASGWDKLPPPPALPDEVVADTRRRYVEAYELLTGRAFDDYLRGS